MKIKNRKNKPLHSSWRKKAYSTYGKGLGSAAYYLIGVMDFRNRAIEALDIFEALSVDPVYRGENKNGKPVMYVSLQDVIALMEGLYA